MLVKQRSVDGDVDPDATLGVAPTPADLVLARDGTILLVTGDMPASWVGTCIGERGNIPGDLKQVAADLLGGNHAVHPPSITIRVPSLDQTICIAVVDAVPVRRAPTDVTSLLQSTLEGMKWQARSAGVQLVVEIDGPIPLAAIDPGKIAWTITALVGNSLRYVRRRSMMKPGGSIIVRAKYSAITSQVMLEVQDDGPGIPEDRLRAILDAPRHGERVGLGLVMVRDVVAAHGGRFEIESETEPFVCGTRVRITLPAA